MITKKYVRKFSENEKYVVDYNGKALSSFHPNDNDKVSNIFKFRKTDRMTFDK